MFDCVDSPLLTYVRANAAKGDHTLLTRLDQWKTRLWERRLVTNADASIYISSIDAGAAFDGKNTRSVMLRNGIFAEDYPKATSEPPEGPRYLGFLGHMGYRPNIDAAVRLHDDIFKPLQREIPDLKLMIIGRAPDPAVLRLAAPDVVVTGAVENIWEYIAKITVFAFPLSSGAGLQNKLLEAMYAGRPVVTDRDVSCQPGCRGRARVAGGRYQQKPARPGGLAAARSAARRAHPRCGPGLRPREVRADQDHGRVRSIALSAAMNVRRRRNAEVPLEDFYAIKVGQIFKHFTREHFAFWSICAYLFFEYVRPQSIVPALDFIPWASLFMALALVGCTADKTTKWVSDAANAWFTVFMLLILASSFNAIYPEWSWRFFFDMLSWYIVYFLLINIITTERRFLIALIVFLIASYKLSFFGARTWAMRGFSFESWGIAGPPGYFENSGELTIQMLMFAPVALLPDDVPQAAHFQAEVLVHDVDADHGGADHHGRQQPRLAAGVGVPIVALPAQGASVHQGHPAGRRTGLRGLVVPSRGAEGAVHIRGQGQDLAAAAAVLGPRHRHDPGVSGAGRRVLQLPALLPRAFSRGSARPPQPQLPHNIFIQVGTDTGITGLIVFGMLLYRNAKTARDIRKLDLPDKPYAALANGFLVALWGFIIAGQFVTVTYYPFFWVNLAFTVALGNIARKAAREAEVARRSTATVPPQLETQPPLRRPVAP